MSNAALRLLILETSDRVGQVAIAEGPTLLQVRTLSESRRHARDLAPAVAELLAAKGWGPRDVDAVVVSKGPGSYTGLRVGVMSAKTFAFATGCRLVGVDTFHAIATQTPAEVDRVDVIADAQQDKIYCQPYARHGSEWIPCAALALGSFGDWLMRRDPTGAVTGPGLLKWEAHVPAEVARVETAARCPSPASLLALGLARLQSSDIDDPLHLEPLYLRPSAAEEQMRTRQQQT